MSLSTDLNISNFSIEFTSSFYTISEDDSLVNLTIVKVPVRDAISTTESITVYFSTLDGTAKGTCIISGVTRRVHDLWVHL